MNLQTLSSLTKKNPSYSYVDDYEIPTIAEQEFGKACDAESKIAVQFALLSCVRYCVKSNLFPNKKRKYIFVESDDEQVYSDEEDQEQVQAVTSKNQTITTTQTNKTEQKKKLVIFNYMIINT